MNTYLKSLIFLFIFSILHFGYEITGWIFLTPFCGINESLFQHLKIAFWSYLLLVLLIEYPFIRNKLATQTTSFWYSRLLSSVILPWIILVIWYLLPALYGKVKTPLVDLIWAIGVTYLSCLFVGFLEMEIEKAEFGLTTRYIILFLVVASGFLFVWFTYRLPWIDLFTNPKIYK